MTDKTTEKLAPCPFCGGEAVFKPDNLYSNDHRNIHASWVECGKCGAEGKHVIDRRDNNCRQEAITAWNTRAAPSSEVGGAREALTGMEADLLAYLDHEYEYRDAYPSEAKKHANEYQLIKARTEIVKAALQSGAGVEDKQLTKSQLKAFRPLQPIAEDQSTHIFSTMENAERFAGAQPSSCLLRMYILTNTKDAER